MESDLDISRSIELAPIEEIAWKMGIGVEELIPFGRHMAKVTWPAIRSRLDRPRGSLVLVTSVNPTRYGEGKTVTTIGLSMGLNKIGKNSACVIREPSMGPVFGIKGGAAGGGHVQVLPMEDINLHFTGDLHAVTSAHNLCSAILDNHLHHGNKLEIDSSRLLWPRVIDMNDRTLRGAAIGLGGPGNGVAREERFDITAASEVMAILALATDYEDLRKRLGNIVIGSTKDGKPVKAEDVGAAGTMALLLRTAFLPNLVQTLENNPAFMHGGPFANIAHGCNSVVSTKTALKLADYVVTEAGFGADLGAEKFFDIKCRKSGLNPDAVVLVATTKALKMHGGVKKDELGSEDVDAVLKGCENLGKHIENIGKFGVPVVVAINDYVTDTPNEHEQIINFCKNLGVQCKISSHWEKGGEGAADLAEEVARIADSNSSDFNTLYENEMSLWDKTEYIAKNIYGASEIIADKKVRNQFKKLEDDGFGSYPICMAKTQYSFSTDPLLMGAPSGHDVPIKEVRLSAGAEFIVVVCGEIMTMPGLPRVPAAEAIGLDEHKEIKGLF